MNFLFISMGMVIIFSGCIATIDGSSFLRQNFSPLVSIISIMIAGLLVRLNRGVPSVDWKAVDIVATRRLLTQIHKVVVGYGITIAILFCDLAVLFLIPVSSDHGGYYARPVCKALSVTFGGLIGLSLARMAYTVWLDLDIVRLQAAVILSAADSAFSDAQREVAIKKADSMRDARIPRS